MNGYRRDKGRLVVTHSTYLDGLIPLLKKLSRCPGVETITPAAICRVRGRAPKLRLNVSVKTLGGFKLMARRGSSAQEVFVITSWQRDQLQKWLDQQTT